MTGHRKRWHQALEEDGLNLQCATFLGPQLKTNWGPKRTQTYSPLPPRFSGWTGFMASHQPKLPPHQWDHITQENFLYLLERQTTFEIYSGWTHEWAFVFCLFFISSWGCKTEAASSFCAWKIPFFSFSFLIKGR